MSVSSSGTGSLIKDPRATPLSAAGTRPSTPTSDNLTSESQERDPYIQGNDQGERKSMHIPSSKAVTRWTNTMDVLEVVSDSEPGEWVSPPPIFTQSRSKKGTTKGSSGKDGKKRIQQGDLASLLTVPTSCFGDEEDSQLGAPPSKRTKAAPHSTTSVSHRSGSGVNNKYVKDDLPPGSTVNNVWRRVFISTLAHFAGGYNDPWTIPPDQFTLVLQQIWDTVYKGKIEHTVTIGGPVYHIAGQGLNNWRGGFAAAAVAIITTFFANDTDFEDPDQRIEFAKAMLKKSRFLFSQNRGTDNKARNIILLMAPFVLQTFAHHFNFIQGQVGVATLDKELAGARTALALACAAVCRMLTLVSNQHVAFKSGNSDNVWTAVIAKGNQYEFNETVWSTSTRRYLDPIKELTDENFALIVKDTQKYVKKASLILSSADSGEEDSGSILVNGAPSVLRNVPGLNTNVFPPL
ncbi:hypothetical protein BU15DRAFT_60932 [Melanogaster broomeanus]|nr:hypothetical protein BU15DRAFT_60932 [Melanogaster broomeanus]